MPPPMTRLSTTSSSALMTPSLSRHLGPAEDGHERARRVARAARAAPRPPWPAGGRPRSGRCCGGPTIEAWARWRRAEGVVDVGVLALDRAGPRRPGRSPSRPGRTAGSRAARRRARARPGGPAPAPSSTAGSGAPFGPAEVAARGDRARPARWSHSRVGRAARMRRSSVIAPSRRGTLKSARTRTRLPVEVAQVLELGDVTRHSALGGADDQRPGRPGGSSSPTRCRTSRAP